MSAWEVTPEDVKTVLIKHGIRVPSSTVNEWHGELDMEEIEGNVLSYTDFDEQVQAAFDKIEDQLIELRYIQGTKQYYSP